MPLRKLDNNGEMRDDEEGWEDEEPEEPSDEEIDEEEAGEEPLDVVLKDASAIIVGPMESETGMRPVLLKEAPTKAPEVPPKRGRHVGGRALSVLSRMPLVGIRYLRASQEFVVYDDQPPPSGEYAVQALGVTTIEYDGVKQNHLLVTFKAGQLTGFAVEDTYQTNNSTYSAGLTDFEIDLAIPLGGRSARTIAISTNRNILVRLNGPTNDPIPIAANISPFIIDLGLNIDRLYLTTYKETKLRMEAW